MRRAVAALAALSAAALPCGADAKAKTFVFGSGLRGSATIVHAHPVDSVFWNVGLPSGLRARAPAKGRVATVQVKGTVVPHGGSPLNLVHFQILHPLPGGQVRVSLTSGNFYVPVGGNPNQVSTYHPVNLCAKPGDYVGFSDIGGYKPPRYPHGTPFRVFARAPRATMNFFSRGGGSDNNGDVFRGSPLGGEEVLMRMVLVTGKDAGYCRNH